jgi:N-acyl-D-amino-acid deacylase
MPHRVAGSTFFILALLSSFVLAADPPAFDTLIRGGMIYDGTGKPGVRADLGIRGDAIAAIGDLTGAKARTVIDANGKAVTPGFINVLSWATESLLQDGRSQSDIRQGVTLEVFGEGWSMGPLSETMKRRLKTDQGELKYDVEWTTLVEYLEHLQRRGVSCNLASFVGATTVRIHELGYEDRKPTAPELEKMKSLVRAEMAEGALGLASALIYAPGFYAQMPELVELAKVAAEYDGVYVSHIRSEGNRLEEAVDEFLQIVREAKVAGEIYHLKAAGQANWPKRAAVIKKLEAARASGLRVTANMYSYAAASTGLDATMPPWVQEGGYARWAERLRDEATRKKVAQEMRTRSDKWENLLLLAGSPEKVLLVEFKNPNLQHLTGRTLAQVAKQRNLSAEEAAIQLVMEDGSRVECVYFLMNEEDVLKNIALPWVSFGSDGGSLAPEGVFLKSQPHPRAYGTFARVLGKYVRDEKVIPLELAIHKMSGLPATTLGLRRRGFLRPDYFADVVVFDPAKIQDHATFEQPHQYATGVSDVLVNGVAVIRNGEHTGAKPGRAVFGPGKYLKKYDAPPVKVGEEAARIHRAGYVFDGHNDLPWELRERASGSFEKFDIARPQPEVNTDIPRLKEGNVGAQFWSVYVPVETAKEGKSLQDTLEQIKVVEDMLRRYPETFEKALTAADVERIQKQGKIASLIGVEGGHSIEGQLANLKRLYELGARYMTLTHSDTLSWADSATDVAKHEGLNDFGEDVVGEMNRLGMLVDLSHVSDETMRDALRVSKAPVIFSHSSSRAIADHVRNVPDDILPLVAANGGVVMVNFFSGFIEPEAAKIMRNMFAETRELAKQFPKEEDFERERKKLRARNPYPAGTVRHVVDHIDHLVRVMGVEHVGIGSDFDGVGKLPAQLESVASYPVITQELLTRGYTAAEIHQILSGNILRAMREAEQVAEKLKN